MKGHGDVFGLTVSHSEALDDDPGILVSAAPSLLYAWHIKNTVAANGYVQFFDVAALTSVNLGTTTPLFSIGIETSGKSHLSLPFPIVFANGIAIFATTTSGGSTAGGMDVELFYA